MSERFDLIAHLYRQREFSLRTFGPGARAEGVIDHIKKELAEIKADPTDLSEWVDVMLLAFDGAWRAGYSPEDIVRAITSKQARNEARQWPDWRTADQGRAIEHVREGDVVASQAECDYFECPECEFSSVQKSDFSGSEWCPMCASDNHDTLMRRRRATDADKAEGFDARLTESAR